ARSPLGVGKQAPTAGLRLECAGRKPLPLRWAGVALEGSIAFGIEGAQHPGWPFARKFEEMRQRPLRAHVASSPCTPRHLLAPPPLRPELSAQTFGRQDPHCRRSCCCCCMKAKRESSKAPAVREISCDSAKQLFFGRLRSRPRPLPGGRTGEPGTALVLPLPGSRARGGAPVKRLRLDRPGQAPTPLGESLCNARHRRSVRIRTADGLARAAPLARDARGYGGPPGSRDHPLRFRVPTEGD